MKLDSKKTLFLIDGSSFLYRAYYSMRPLHSPQGKPVQAVYGFCRMIKKLIDMFQPEYLAVVWDSKGKTTRHEMYEDYKATRQAPPSDLFEQKELILEIADIIGVKQLMQQGIEADDIMYSLAQEQKKEGNITVFVTADKDMAQALDEHVIMYDTFKEAFITAQVYEEKNGFPVSRIPLYYSLLGDASDNIPGVHGVGKKGAADLAQQFASLEDLYDHLELITKPRLKKALEEQKDRAFLSRKLFLLQRHPVGVTQQELAFNRDDWSNAYSFFQQFNFKSFLKDAGKDPNLIKRKIELWQKYDLQCVTTMEQLEALATLLREKGAFAFDTETSGVRPLQDTLVGLSFCVQEGQAFYVPCAHQVDEFHLETCDVLAVLRPIFEDASYKKYLHNAKFDQLVMFKAGVTVRGVAFDSLIAGRLVAQEWERSALKFLSSYYFNEDMLTYDDVVKTPKRTCFAEVPLALATLYSAADSLQTFRLKPLLEKKLHEQKLTTIYYDIELPLVQVLVSMEAAGIALDVPLLEQLDKRVSAELVEIRTKIIDQIGPHYAGINLNSPRQVEELLFQELKLPPQKKRAKGAGYSTDQEVLLALAHLHEVPGLIVRYRELAKLKSTYIDALPTYVNPNTGRIHTTYSQTGVATGRLASSDPNLQNIPASGIGIEIRAAFKPKEGHVYLSADYSQIELRVLAHLSQDPTLQQAFLSGHDIHAQTAAGLFDVPLEDVTHEQRQIGKRINFSILYGLTPYGLSQDLGISFGQAKSYIDKYFAQYPRVLTWMDHIVEQAKKFGYVRTLWGRRRYVPAINEKNQALYQEARRVAVNTVAQGTAAELMKRGMIELDAAFKREGVDAHMLLQIHDELLISVAQEQMNEVERLTRQVLENVVSWRVPLEVTMRSGSSWKEVSK